MHGGTVEGRSEGPGRGSEFVVRSAVGLPAGPPRDGEEEEKRPLHACPPARRILVVDDNVDSAESLGTMLKLMGNEVRIAHDGPSALEAAEAFLPDIVLLDIGMPGMDGYEVARRLRRTPALKHALLVAQTGWGQEEDRRRSEQAGFDHHLVKPVDLAVLASLLAMPG